MRRLLLVWLVMVLAAQGAQAELYPDVFWDRLTYNGKLIDLSVLPPDPDYNPEIYGSVKSAYLAWFKFKAEGQFMWSGIEFSMKHGNVPPNDVALSGFCEGGGRSLWVTYFNEMYYQSGKDIWRDENGYSPFWDGYRFNGERIDPDTPPPNYDPAMDCYREIRPALGYQWYWGYYLYWYGLAHYGLDTQWEDISHSWNGIEFDMQSVPPDYSENYYYYNGEVEPAAGRYSDYVTVYAGERFSNLYIWEDYFNRLYYENLEQ